METMGKKKEEEGRDAISTEPGTYQAGSYGTLITMTPLCLFLLIGLLLYDHVD
jgi:hypothetical protein